MVYTGGRSAPISRGAAIGGAMALSALQSRPVQYRLHPHARNVRKDSRVDHARIDFTRGPQAMDRPLASPGQSPRRQESWE